MVTIRAFSYGGGVQSTAALVLAAQGRIDFPVFLFANTGDDSEHPDTLRYVREVAMPYAEEQGIQLHETARRFRRGPRKGERVTLYQELITNEKSIGIPMRMSGNGAPSNRACTVDYKIDWLDYVLRQMGATKADRAVIGLGISLDELERMSSDDPDLVSTKEYPLIDLRLTRQDCMNIISRAGLPVPPKSSCWFCPFHTAARWREMKEHEPELFQRAVELERLKNEHRRALGKDEVWLSRTLRPLDQALAGTQHEMDFDDTCESGFCMT
jgi:hypothetical protein